MLKYSNVERMQISIVGLLTLTKWIQLLMFKAWQWVSLVCFFDRILQNVSKFFKKFKLHVMHWCFVRTSRTGSACPVKSRHRHQLKCIKVKATSLLSSQTVFCHKTSCLFSSILCITTSSDGKLRADYKLLLALLSLLGDRFMWKTELASANRCFFLLIALANIRKIF